MSVHAPRVQAAIDAMRLLTRDEHDEVFVALNPVSEPVEPTPGEPENRWTSPNWEIVGIPNCMGGAHSPDACTCKRACVRWKRVKR